ncbi:MAG: trehalose 6-phosphate phosphatase [Thermoleophilaceae bacterium]|jgi:trehalose 6-phosphate phosphatase|nr:trehalose 6-phosphate phosphatase [Thermoleophilaceae bacterium]
MLAGALRPLTEAPERAAVLCDIDGTLAPIVRRAEEARVPPEATRALAALASRYGVVACVSGRSAMDARRLVGVGGIAYAGAHGAELLMPGERGATILPEFADYAEPVHRVVDGLDDDELRGLGVRVEDKGPIVALHWRGADDEEAARAWLERVAREIDGDGLATHWGRKVLEIRPPIPVTKARAVEELVARSGVRTALFGGDDTTDLDAFDALDSLVAKGELDAAVRVGVASEEGPAGIVERADLVVKGTHGFQAVLAALAGA